MSAHNTRNTKDRGLCCVYEQWFSLGFFRKARKAIVKAVWVLQMKMEN